MANLSELKDLITRAESLEKEVDKLQKDRDALLGEKITILASIKYAQELLDKIKLDVSSADLEHKTTMDIHNTELSNVVKCIEARKAEIEPIERCIKQLTDDLDIKNKEYIDLTATKSAELSSITSQVENMTLVRDTLLTEVDTLTKKTTELRTIDDDLRAKKDKLAETTLLLSDKDKDLEKINNTIETKQGLLDNLVDSYDETQETIEKAKKEHTEFIEYEKNARKTLESHEQSILEREKELKQELTKAKHQNRILDKTS